MVTEREYGGEIQETGLVPYRKRSSETGLVPYRRKSSDIATREDITDAEYKVVTEPDEDMETEALTSEQVLRMSKDEIEAFRIKRARDFQVSLGVSATQAKRMADEEIDLAVEVTDKERGFAEAQKRREAEWDERSRQFAKEKPTITEEDEEILKETEEEIQEVKEKTPKEESLAEKMFGKRPEKITEKEIPKDTTPKESLIEKLFGKRKPEVPLSPKEIKLLRIQKSKEEHLQKVAEIKERLKAGRGIGKPRGVSVSTEGDISFKNIGKGSMGAKEYGYREPASTDFFGTKEFMIGTKTPEIGEKGAKVGLPSTKLKPIGTKPPSTQLKPVGITPPSTSFGGGGSVDVASLVGIGFGASKAPVVGIRPVILKDKLEKPKIVKPAEFSLGFSNTIPDINASLSLGKPSKSVPVKKPSQPAFIPTKNPVEDWGIDKNVKNPVSDWGFGEKREISSKNKKKSKKESLDFLKM